MHVIFNLTSSGGFAASVDCGLGESPSFCDFIEARTTNLLHTIEQEELLDTSHTSSCIDC